MGKTKWQKSKVSNLYKEQESGWYYGRASVGGKEKWQSLRTKVFSTAKLRLADWLRDVRAVRGTGIGECSTCGDLRELYFAAVDASGVKDVSKRIRKDALNRVFRTWEGLAKLDPAKVSREDVDAWFARFLQCGSGFVPPGSKSVRRVRPLSASAVNKSIDSLRGMFALGVDRRLLTENPVRLKHRKEKRKEYPLYNLEEFAAWVGAIRGNRQNGWADDAADLVECMAYSGAYPGELGRLRPEDIYFRENRVRIRGTKSAARDRWLPMNADLRGLFSRMIERRGRLATGSPVFRITSCRGAMDRASDALGLPRLDHKAMRHFFCTRCVEAGVRFSTLAEWMGHADRGELLRRQYNHLSDAYSQEQSELVRFAPEGEKELRERERPLF